MLGHKLRLENMGPSEGAVFAYDKAADRTGSDLQHQGVPIEGEVGVGYRLGAGLTCRR